MNSKLFCLALASTFVFGCYAPQADTDESAEAPATYTRTVVRFNEDGTETVAEFTVTAEQQRADVAARMARGHASATAPAAPGAERIGTAAAAISTDSCSDYYAMWLFDQASHLGREICFIGAGTANLATYVRRPSPYPQPPLTWSNAVKSFFAGEEGGGFYLSGGIFNNYETFTSYESVFSADSIVQGSDTMFLNP